MDRGGACALGGAGPLRGRPKPAFAGSLKQALLIATVVATGCANNISKQVAARPLERFTYMLGLATSLMYVPLYGAVMLALLRYGSIPRCQLDFVWRSRRGVPCIVFFIVAALGDTLGSALGMICTPYVSGPVHSLLSNCTMMFIAVLSMCFLQKRYSLLQCLSLTAVLAAVVIGVAPSFERGGSAGTRPFFAAVLGASCIFNAASFVVKELLFQHYKSWRTSAGLDEDGGGSGLHVFVMNTHASLFQLPLTLLAVPLNEAFGQTNGDSVFAYMSEALTCVFRSSRDACGSDSVGAEWAGTCVAVYVVCNIAWNVSVLLCVKHSGALATFVALKAIFPVSTLLFAYVDWPLLGPTSLSWLVWLSVALMLPSIAVYQYASAQQAARTSQHPSLATCCWPFGAASPGSR